MSEKKVFRLVHRTARAGCIDYISRCPDGLTVTIAEPTRSQEQNSLLWALLTDLAEQVTWHGQKLTKEEWKDACTAALKRQKVIPGIDGGFVVLGTSTSRMSKAELSDLVEFIYAFGAQQNVAFSNQQERAEPALAACLSTNNTAG